MKFDWNAICWSLYCHRRVRSLWEMFGVNLSIARKYLGRKNKKYGKCCVWFSFTVFFTAEHENRRLLILLLNALKTMSSGSKKTATKCPKRVLSNFILSYGIQWVLTYNICPTSDHNDRASTVFFVSYEQIQEHKLFPQRRWIHGQEMEVQLHWFLTSALEGSEWSSSRRGRNPSPAPSPGKNLPVPWSVRFREQTKFFPCRD
jgi:hypothetical protein